MFNQNYNPDILTCLANLSNDEVFTPSKIVNEMLDMLPNSLWSNPNATFLDPACKTGVFLREIAKRLLKGLEEVIPDQQQRINHILTKQLFGISITELTSLVSKRSLYCSKYANGEFSICTGFDNEDGNIRYNPCKHTWSFDNCIYCGVNKKTYERPEELETHAYEFIHTGKVEELLNMKFDVIIGNPPYQLNDGGGMGSSAIPLYNRFVEQAKKLQPRYLTMIIPSRWFSGGKGLDTFRNNMLRDNRIRKIHDFINASDCFPGVEIKGGVCYFLWDRDNKGKCEVTTHEGDQITSIMTRPLLEKKCDIFIRYNEAISILKKIDYNNSFSTLVSVRNPFGYSSNYKKYSKEPNPKCTKIYYMNKGQGWLDSKVSNERNKELLGKWKILVAKAIGRGDMKTDILKPFIAEPNSVCTETYLAIGPFDDQKICENVISYMNTKFFHFFLGLKKITQNSTKDSYSLIPMQSFEEEWSDEKLYKKYQLTSAEIAFIESMVHPSKEEEEHE